MSFLQQQKIVMFSYTFCIYTILISMCLPQRLVIADVCCGCFLPWNQKATNSNFRKNAHWPFELFFNVVHELHWILFA